MKKYIVFLLACSLFFACKNATVSNKPDLLTANIDSTVKPGDDFFEYANGGWIKRTPMPESESGWGIGNLVQDEIYNRLKKINEDAVKSKNEEGSITQKIGDFWQTAMDTAALDKAGLSPLKSDLDKVNGIKDPGGLLTVAAELKMKGVNCLFGDYVSQDDKNSEMMAYRLDHGGLGMPNRDYYFNTDERTIKVRMAYLQYMQKTFRQLGNSELESAKIANAVLGLESKLAKASRKLEDLRDPYKNYNKMDLTGLNKMAGNINWADFIKNTGITKID
jgi:putative endopeptidase